MRKNFIKRWTNNCVKDSLKLWLTVLASKKNFEVGFVCVKTLFVESFLYIYNLFNVIFPCGHGGSSLV